MLSTLARQQVLFYKWSWLDLIWVAKMKAKERCSADVAWPKVSTHARKPWQNDAYEWIQRANWVKGLNRQEILKTCALHSYFDRQTYELQAVADGKFTVNKSPFYTSVCLKQTHNTSAQKPSPGEHPDRMWPSSSVHAPSWPLRCLASNQDASVHEKFKWATHSEEPLPLIISCQFLFTQIFSLPGTRKHPLQRRSKTKDS